MDLSSSLEKQYFTNNALSAFICMFHQGRKFSKYPHMYFSVEKNQFRRSCQVCLIKRKRKNSNKSKSKKGAAVKLIAANGPIFGQAQRAPSNMVNLVESTHTPPHLLNPTSYRPQMNAMNPAAAVGAHRRSSALYSSSAAAAAAPTVYGRPVNTSAAREAADRAMAAEQMMHMAWHMDVDYRWRVEQYHQHQRMNEVMQQRQDYARMMMYHSQAARLRQGAGGPPSYPPGSFSMDPYARSASGHSNHSLRLGSMAPPPPQYYGGYHQRPAEYYGAGGQEVGASPISGAFRKSLPVPSSAAATVYSGPANLAAGASPISRAFRKSLPAPSSAPATSIPRRHHYPDNLALPTSRSDVVFHHHGRSRDNVTSSSYNGGTTGRGNTASTIPPDDCAETLAEAAAERRKS